MQTSDGPVRALSGVSLKIARGEFVSFIGPSGCGKTTLLRAIADLESADRRDDPRQRHEPARGAGEARLRLCVPGAGALSLAHGRRQHRAAAGDHGRRPRPSAAKRVERGLELVNLKGFGGKFPWQLSGGMQQRASIARALSFDPDLLLMDEPFGALDEIVRDMLNQQLLRLWAKTGKTALFVTHSIPEAVFLSTRIVVMSPRPGRIHEVIECNFPRDRTLDIRETPEFLEVAHRVRQGLREGHSLRCVRASPSPPASPVMARAPGEGVAARSLSGRRRIPPFPETVGAPETGARAARMNRVLPLLTVLAALFAVWYVAAVLMNAPLQRDLFANADNTTYTTADLITASLNMERPKLPAPHQIAAELYKLIFATDPTSKRSLVFHAAITLEETLIGFVIGAALGIGLAVLIVAVPFLERSLMPWIVASQTVPIIALAPMIVVILNQFDIGGMTPKAVIAAYLSFFPITVGMAKGFRSPDPLQLDLMRTYSATPRQVLSKLRAPASLPFFFASMKIGAAAALVGAVVAEVTKSEDGGLGARLLAGSYYGQTVQIWAALFTAAALSGALVGADRPDRPRYAQAPGVPGMNARRFRDLAPPLLFGLARAARSGKLAVRRLRRAGGHPARALGDRGAAASPPSRRSPPISCRRSAACSPVI